MRPRSLVVDVTYACNAECGYCRWGNVATRGRRPDPGPSLIPAPTLESLGVQRVVISGGEPTLHPGIRGIISHYAGLVEQVVVITNGYGLADDLVSDLLDAGATGITVSLDSVSPVDSLLARRTNPRVHARVLGAVSRLCRRGGVEAGINATVSHVTAEWGTVCGLLEFGLREGADFVKFQPVFDDGYVSASAPGLVLSGRDVDSLLEIASMVGGADRPPTNPPDFWRDVARLAGGGALPADGCGIGPHDTMAAGGRMRICYWVGSSEYGPVPAPLSPSCMDAARAGFEADKPRCAVGFHCFCNQRLGHAWTGGGKGG